jgi:hypothetical protein
MRQPLPRSRRTVFVPPFSWKWIFYSAHLDHGFHKPAERPGHGTVIIVEGNRMLPIAPGHSDLEVEQVGPDPARRNSGWQIEESEALYCLFRLSRRGRIQPFCIQVGEVLGQAGETAGSLY